jgi:hypothetical protein
MASDTNCSQFHTGMIIETAGLELLLLNMIEERLE